jgi:DNA-binding Lrp family transcriptional regulator
MHNCCLWFLPDARELQSEIRHALVANPGRSNGMLARLLGCSPHSVAIARSKLEEAGAIEQFRAQPGRTAARGFRSATS